MSLVKIPIDRCEAVCAKPNRSEVVIKDGVGAAAQFAAVLGPDALAPVVVAAGLGQEGGRRKPAYPAPR